MSKHTINTKQINVKHLSLIYHSLGCNPSHLTEEDILYKVKLRSNIYRALFNNHFNISEYDKYIIISTLNTYLNTYAVPQELYDKKSIIQIFNS